MTSRPRLVAKMAWTLALALGLVGCARGCPSSRPPIHLNPNMDYQPKYQAQEESDFFYDGRAMREPVPGTVAREELTDAPVLLSGKDEGGNLVRVSPLEATDELLIRGEQRFDIYCRPCHEKKGTGRGILFEYGGVPTPSFHEQRILDLTDGELFDVITNGKNLMRPYRYPIPPRDRWAIVAHVRRLQQERLTAQGGQR